jgi:hypothetical protein
MDKKEIKNILNQKYERANFQNLTQLVFKKCDYFSIPKSIETKNDKVQNFLQLGNIELSDGKRLAILELKLKKEINISKNRVELRNLTAKFIDQVTNHGVLVIFDNDGGDYRLTFSTKYSEIDNEGNLIEHENNPKRYSYLLGENESCFTASERLSILESRKLLTIENVIDAFSVEKVTDQFFEEYKKLSQNLEEDITALRNNIKKINDIFLKNYITEINFAKKLLGQIVFLYFIQKKGWLGIKKNKEGKFLKWGEGSKSFFKDLFEKKYCNYNNFFNDVLEPLFYNGFAVDLSESYYAELDCKIPFLNGGLFEPIKGYNWQETNIAINNNIIRNIIEVFDRYNFTVNEESNIEKEVAVDPEMLGKVFEKLLPDNLQADNGVYYTPREVVSYICKESLSANISSNFHDTLTFKELKFFFDYIEDLDLDNENISLIINDKKNQNILINKKKIEKYLSNIKICDPAVGSGAFPVSIMNLIVKVRIILNYTKDFQIEKNLYKYKKEFLQNSIYCVDIDSAAVEIAKLRLWLSLIVDENNFDKIDPLPNLDYKIMQGNSLISEVLGFDLDINNIGLTKDLFDDSSNLEEKIVNLQNLQQSYFEAKHYKNKKNKKDEVENLIKEIFQILLEKFYKLNNKDKKSFQEIQQSLDGKIDKKFFLWKIYYQNIFKKFNGFDIVIGNPPYGAKIDESEKMIIKKHFDTSISNKDLKGSLNSFSLFTELGFKLLNDNGTLNYILPIAITCNDSCEKLHQLLMNNCNFIKMSSYAVRPQPVFENAYVNTSIFMFNKSKNYEKKILATKMYRKKNNLSLKSIINNHKFVDIKNISHPGRFPKIGDEIEKKIFTKIMNINSKIKDFYIKDDNSELIKTEIGKIYYRSAGGRYFKLFTNFSTDSSAEKILFFNKKYFNSIGAILSSNLFFWYYQIISDNLNLKLSDILNFPLPNLAKKDLDNLTKIYSEYLIDIKKNSNIRVSTKDNFYKTEEFIEFKIGKSKRYIDEIDNIISEYYFLNKQELNFIKSYEIEYRLS